LVAELEQGHRLSYVERHVLIADNIPLTASVIIPTVLLVMAGLGLVELGLAIDLSILLSLASLFIVGSYQARKQGASLGRQLGIGTLGGALGVIVVILEVSLSH